MTPEPTLSLAESVVLAVIDEGPTHGFAIAALTAAGGSLGRVWQVPRPVVYRAIGRLAELGLVEPESVQAGRGPQRTVYRTTTEGAQRVAGWLAAPVEHVRDVRSQLLLKLALLDRIGSDPVPLLRRQREVLAPIVAAVAAEPEPAGGFDGILLAWRRATTAATTGFLDDVLAALGPTLTPGKRRPAPAPRRR